MREAFRNLVALNWNVFVGAICDDFKHTGIILFQDLESLLTVMNRSDPSIDEFFFDSSFILLVSNVR